MDKDKNNIDTRQALSLASSTWKAYFMDGMIVLRRRA